MWEVEIGVYMGGIEIGVKMRVYMGWRRGF